MRDRWLVTLLTRASCGYLPGVDAYAQDSKPCSESSELECIHSPKCTLVQTAQHGGYVCRAAQGHCEEGFLQAGDGDIRKNCEARRGCEFKPASCYCPPNVDCRCGGGPPAQCVESRKTE